MSSRWTYGSPRIHAELREEGLRCSRKRVARLMRQAGIEGCHRRRSIRTTERAAETEQVPDLVERNFKAEAPNRLWLTDFTYVPTLAGFLYLAVVLDAFSRRVIGWAMGPRPTMQLVIEALDMAIWNRKADPGVVHHSDHGSRRGRAAAPQRPAAQRLPLAQHSEGCRCPPGRPDRRGAAGAGWSAARVRTKELSLRPHVARTLATLTVPQGYTLSIAGTFAIASNRYGSPFTAEAWGFVAGAVAAFLTLATVSGRHLARPATLPPATRATFNVVPVVSVLVGAAATYAVPWPPLGYPVAGAVAVSGYVLLVSLFFALTSG